MIGNDVKRILKNIRNTIDNEFFKECDEKVVKALFAFRLDFFFFELQLTFKSRKRRKSEDLRAMEHICLVAIMVFDNIFFTQTKTFGKQTHSSNFSYFVLLEKECC